MGCDIHVEVQVRHGDEWRTQPGVNPFDCRSYGLFGFLANVRNYSEVPPISDERGFPEGFDTPGDYEGYGHSPSWLSLKELLEFDYDQIFENRRYTKQTGPNFFDGGATCEPGQGKLVTYRDFLGEWFFNKTSGLGALGKPEDVRIVFWFDN